MRTFWLSFCDEDKPEGQCFLGVAVVDVTPEEADAIQTKLDAMFPHRQEGSEWMAAATQKARALGCNPGGQVAFWEITGSEEAAKYPRHQLLSRAELEAIAPIMTVGELDRRLEESARGV